MKTSAVVSMTAGCAVRRRGCVIVRCFSMCYVQPRCQQPAIAVSPTPYPHSGHCWGLELETNLREDFSFIITEKAPNTTRTFSWLKAPTHYIFKTLIRQYMLNWHYPTGPSRCHLHDCKTLRRLVSSSTEDCKQSRC